MKQIKFLLVFILFISCDNNSKQPSNSDAGIDNIELNDNCFDEIKTELIDSIRDECFYSESRNGSKL